MEPHEHHCISNHQELHCLFQANNKKHPLLTGYIGPVMRRTFASPANAMAQAMSELELLYSLPQCLYASCPSLLAYWLRVDVQEAWRLLVNLLTSRVFNTNHIMGDCPEPCRPLEWTTTDTSKTMGSLIAKHTEGLDSDLWIPLRGGTRIPWGLYPENILGGVFLGRGY